MYQSVYVIWGLLPFTFLCLTLWAILKPWFKVKGREHPKRYFQQFIYCLLCLIVAIVFDQYFLETVMAFSGDLLDISMVRWLLYPMALFLLSPVPIGRQKKTPKAQRFVFTSW